MAVMIGQNTLDMDDCFVGGVHIGEIYAGDTKIWPARQPLPGAYLTFSTDGEQGIRFHNDPSGLYFEYSYDTIHWTKWANVTSDISFSATSPLYLRGMNETISLSNDWAQIYFSGTGNIYVSGNIMHLLDYTQNLTAVPDYCFYNLFINTGIVTAPDLPATTLGAECYANMFRACSSLATAPELPATTLANTCYYGMFYGCTSLTEAPDLPATALTSSCYSAMFQGCTNLNYIKCMAISRGIGNTSHWVDGVAPTGTFVKASGSTWSTNVSGIPSGWTVEEE